MPYVLSKAGSVLIVSMYVDDLKFKRNMMESYEISDLDLLHCFFGIEVSKEKDEIFICQKKYAKSILQKFNMSTGKAVDAPLVIMKNYQKIFVEEKLMHPHTEI